MSISVYEPRTLYDYLWPDSDRRRPLAPVRVGMDRLTGKMIIGERHEDQSLFIIFSTRYHTRVLRRWCGSFVPHLLGQSAVKRVIARFYWAIFTALDLFEPNVRITRVRVLSRDGTGNPEQSLTSTEELRAGHITFRLESIRRPRGHLGDFTPEGRRTIGIVRRARSAFDRIPA